MFAGCGALPLLGAPVRAFGQSDVLLPLARLAQPGAVPPKTYPATSAETLGPNHRAMFFDGLPYRGKPTRVFAIYGVPDDVSKPVPAVVLVHGGGGSAYAGWVRQWTRRGYAAISISVEGNTDAKGEGDAKWARHALGGPARVGVYGDTEQPLPDQWMYHAVADTILAHTLIRSFKEVDSARVGLVGISWGGVITLTTAPLDPRFAFAVPIYATGYYSRITGSMQRAYESLGQNKGYTTVWEPGLRLDRIRAPMLWLFWLQERHASLLSLRDSRLRISAPHIVSIRPDWKHNHPAGWTAPDSYAFADSIVRTGRPWARQINSGRRGVTAFAEFSVEKPVTKSTLLFTEDRGHTGTRNWRQGAVVVQQSGRRVRVSADVSPGATAWFLNLNAGELTLSSDVGGA